ncbi:phospholipase D-like domain-containing protein [Pseudoroseicyclus aestuarii]|uniref:Phospholipase D1/2 n=1 Tax=Pseudoroseicyclus aestuarii TaxID=1795041 RepID=A0A318SVT5_9RHOB|nr:phospholipase D-like domain-containing protein [Pseudoroseicyclus aestuarii]PYE86021.1 phospholipase D1/2 [Pseudoroseicyclus aestuarii]
MSLATAQAADPVQSDILKDRAAPAPPGAPPRVLITASEAYPEFERRFLNAKRRVRMCFRVFDPFTRLRSDEARAIGADWYDLIVHKLRQGLDVELTITDFDPIAVTPLHAATWDSIRAMVAAEEAAGAAGPEGIGRLILRPGMHPARVGTVPRLLLSLRSYGEVARLTHRLNRLPMPERIEQLRTRPGLRQHVAWRPEGKLRPRLTPVPEFFPVTHHQKIAIFDDDWLYVGGLDLDERRFDDWAHERPAQETWHDVQLLVQGRAVQDAHRHLDTFLRVNSGQERPVPTGQLLRTLSSRRRFPVLRMSPAPAVQELEQAHLDQITVARDLLYIETQFLRDRGIARALARAGRRQPGLGLIVVLPAAPETAAFEAPRADAKYGEYLQARCIEKIRRAFGDRVLFVSPAGKRRADETDHGPRAKLFKAPIIYVHAKVAIGDTDSAIVSSANLNGRSLHWDTEAGLRLRAADYGPDAVRDIRTACMTHWMGEAGPPRDGETGPEVVARWRAQVRADSAREPSTREQFLLPYVLRPALRIARNMPGVPESMV